MPRPYKTDRPRKIKISLPESLAGEIELRLFSPLVGRVPFGDWSAFFEALARRAIAEANVQQAQQLQREYDGTQC